MPSLDEYYDDMCLIEFQCDDFGFTVVSVVRVVCSSVWMELGAVLSQGMCFFISDHVDQYPVMHIKDLDCCRQSLSCTQWILSLHEDGGHWEDHCLKVHLCCSMLFLFEVFGDQESQDAMDTGHRAACLSFV